MIRWNKAKGCYEWDRWDCGNWTPLSVYTAERLMDDGEVYVGEVE